MNNDILKILSVLSGLLPIIFFLAFFKRNKEKKLWVIFLYTLISLITDIGFSAITKKQEFYLFSFFTLIEYTIFTIFLYYNIKSKTIRWFIIGGSAVFFIFAIYSLLNTKNYNFDSLPASIESILVILYSILFFFEQIKNTEVSFIYSSKTFWIIVAILIYLAATLFLFISTAYITPEERESYWSINFISNILKNALLAIAFALPNYRSQVHKNQNFDSLFEKPPIN